MKLLILSNVIHYRHGGRLWAYGAYAREIDIWADIFSGVAIAAPLRDAVPAGLAVPFSRAGISVIAQPEVGGETLRAKLSLLLAMPVLVWNLCRAMLRADAVHVRCPGSFGLLGVLLAPICAGRRVAKYAGQWTGYPGEPWSYRLQRRLLRSRWWGSPVTVYGRWPEQPAHVVPFFTSVLGEQHLDRARRAAARKQFGSPLRTLFTGRLTSAKNVDVLIRSVAQLRADGYAVECDIVGEGPELPALQRLASDLGIAPAVRFTGGLAFERVLDRYEQCDVLVLASETEGWPKALAEAMAFGLVPVGSDRGLVPQMLSGGRGVVVPPRDQTALTDVLRRMARDPQSLYRTSARAAAWGQRYSLEHVREALRAMLAERWNVTLAPAARGEGASRT